MRPATEQLERGVERGDRPALGERERGAAPDQQAAEGHDERWDADVGDEEALESADQRAQGDADEDDEDPGARLIEARPRTFGIHSVWSRPMTIAVNPRIDPIDRSMLRDTMISTMPVVMIATAADWTDRFHRLRGGRNRPSDSKLNDEPEDDQRDATMPSSRTSNSNGGQRGPHGPRPRLAAALAGSDRPGLGRHAASISRGPMEVRSALRPRRAAAQGTESD